MSTRLKDVKIKCISILIDDKKPANGLGVIVKDDDGDNFVIEMDIHKFDPEGFLIVRPMISKIDDSDDEHYDDDDLVEASYNAIKNIQKNGGTMFDTNHDFEILEDVYFVETLIKEVDDVKVWEMKLDIRENALLLEKAKAGLINGVSIAASAQKIKSKNKKDKNIFSDTGSFLSKIAKSNDIKKDFDTMMDNRKNNDFYPAMDVLWASLWQDFDEFDWEDNIDKAEMIKRFKKTTAQFIKHVKNMTFEVKKEKGNTKLEGEDEMNKEETLELFKSDEFKELVKNAAPKQEIEKDAEGNPITMSSLLGVLTDVKKSNEALKAELEELKTNDSLVKSAKQKEYDELLVQKAEMEKALGMSSEIDNGKVVVEKSKTKRSALEIAM